MFRPEFHSLSALGYAATLLAARSGSHWLPAATIEWALCAAALSATIVALEGWSRDPDGLGRAAWRSAIASATSLIGVLVGAI